MLPSSMDNVTSYLLNKYCSAQAYVIQVVKYKSDFSLSLLFCIGMIL